MRFAHFGIAVVAVLCLSLLAWSSNALRPTNPVDDPTFNPGLRSYNRYSAFTVDDPVFGTNFPLTADAIASYRFTNHGARTVDWIWLYYETCGTQSMMYQVSLYDDDCGLPGNIVTTQTFSVQPPSPPNWRWIRLTTNTWIGDDETWHVVLEPVAGVSDSSFITLISAMNRFPVPFQPLDHEGGARRVSGLDPNFALLYDDDRNVPPALLVQRSNVRSFSPLFLLEACDTPIALGNPYNVHDEPEVCGRDRFGQRIRPDQDLTVNHVAMFVRAAGMHGDGVPSGPLKLRLQRLETNGTRTPLETVALIDPGDGVSMTNGRSHYFTAYFCQPHTLFSGVTYELLLLTETVVCDCINDRWLTSLESSTLVPDHSLLPTFGIAASHAFYTVDGGSSYIDLLDADLPFILSELPDDPLAHMDEFGSAGRYPLELGPGKAFTFKVTVRNLGRLAGVGDVYARLIDREAPVPPLVTAFSTQQLKNDQEASNFTLTSNMPNSPPKDLFMWLEVGHLTPQENEVIDEQIPIEIRLK